MYGDRCKQRHAQRNVDDVPDGEEADIGGIDGWVIAHRKTGMLFLRRIQVLNQTAIEGLFWDVLKLAIDNGWQFHSWCHEPDLTDLKFS